MKKKFYYLLALTSLFSLFSCSSNEPSNITSLQIGYNGSTSILEGTIVTLDQIVNGTIDNENKFVFFTTSNNDIAYVKNNNLYTKNVNKNEDIIVTLEDKYTHINSSLSLLFGKLIFNSPLSTPSIAFPILSIKLFQEPSSPIFFL